MTHSSEGTRPAREIRGGHVLLAMLAFFGTIVAVDSFLIYKAVSTFGGVENVNAYREGLAYNRRIEIDEKQAALGWQDRVEARGTPLRLSVSLEDGDGAAIVRRNVVADLGRPATNRFDRTLRLAEVSPGVYEGALADAEPGSWLVDVRVSKSGDGAAPDYQVRRRLWIAP
ncbi:MAG TPA: FixH family protein [Hyphomicrobium sp.]|nr:FixH family protein [Hyphomicrobium sp.]